MVGLTLEQIVKQVENAKERGQMAPILNVIQAEILLARIEFLREELEKLRYDVFHVENF